jgi:beta-glucanase (GH16 family)
MTWKRVFVLPGLFALIVATPIAVYAQPSGGCSGVANMTVGSTTYAPQWCQEFNGAAGSPDTTVWTFGLGNNGGWGNGEQEVYCGPPGYPNNPSQCPTTFSASTAPVYIDGIGHLVIQPIYENGAWLSARMNTEGMENFTYGILEASIEVPNVASQGLWPAWWTMGTDCATVAWPTCGEADILEDWSPTVYNGAGDAGINSTIHTALTGGDGVGARYNFPSGEASNSSFHIYGMIWTENRIQFFVDTPASPFFTVTPASLPSGDTWPFNAGIFALLNVAVGGTLGGSDSGLASPASPMTVDYVRWYTAATGTAPAAPANLTATAASLSQINLSWTASATPGVTYTVLRYGEAIATGVTGTTYSDTGLTAATQYSYTVEAVNSSGASPASNPATATTASGNCTAVPSAPTGLAASASSSSVIGLNWTAVAPPANCTVGSYNVYSSTVSGFTPGASNLIAGGVTGASYTDTGLAASTAYYFAVEAVDADGASLASAQATATTQAAALSNGTYTLTPQNATALRLDDDAASTATGNTIWVYTANNTAAQNWTAADTGVTPSGYFNFATLGPYCLTASGTASASSVVLDPCDGSTAQAWQAVTSGNFYIFHPANNTANCLDVRGDGTATETIVQVYACNGGNNEEWALTVAGAATNPIVPYIAVNGNWNTTPESAVTVASGTSVSLGPWPISGGTWSWTGPNGFASTAREIDNIPLSAGANVYTATYTFEGASYTQAFTVTATSASPIVPYIAVNGVWNATPESAVTVAQGTSVSLGPWPVSGGAWSWTGPNGFASTAREIDNIPLSAGASTYTATYTAGGATYTQAFVVTLTTGACSTVNPIVPYIAVDGVWNTTPETTVTVASGTAVNLGPWPIGGGTWSWTGPNGFTSTAREIDAIPLSAGANVYTAAYTVSGCSYTQPFTITVN